MSLREVLVGDDVAKLRRQIARLQTIGSLMEKQSRVASWGVRTVTGLTLAAVGFLLYDLLGSLTHLDPVRLGGLRASLVGVLGAIFLYYGLKAVQLTDMANRLWKRSVEYSLILDERQRLQPGREHARMTRVVRAL